jgi:hypothetical protein
MINTDDVSYDAQTLTLATTAKITGPRIKLKSMTILCDKSRSYKRPKGSRGTVKLRREGDYKS